MTTSIRTMIIVGGLTVAALFVGCDKTPEQTETTSPPTTLSKPSIGHEYGATLHSALSTAEEVREKLELQEFERRERNAAAERE